MADVGIVGTGVAGLACARFLHGSHRVSVFEQDTRIGGHAHTMAVFDGREVCPVDTGFMVYNEVTYPLLTRLFRELAVPTRPTSMSFSVRYEPDGTEFSGSSINHLFAQRKNLLRPRYWRFLWQIDRFNREAVAALGEAGTARQSLGEYVRAREYGEDFLRWYLLPMAGAVWSSPPHKTLDFPATTLLRFFHNHGFLGLRTQHPWRTVTGGSRTYVEALSAPFRHRIRAGAPVTRIRRRSQGVDVELITGEVTRFDHVVLACHADQALGLLADPTPDEERLLGAFRYELNETFLHTDTSVMPRTRMAWSSWNHRVGRALADGVTPTSTHYWMNSLQGVSERENYFVSLNARPLIDPTRIVRRIEYAHPLFDRRAVDAQAELPRLNQRPERQTYFCGSYFRYGFHEDALRSGYDAAAELLQRDPWPEGAVLPANGPSPREPAPATTAA